MKLRDVKELHTKTSEELLKQLKDIQSEIAKMKIDSKLGKVKNVAIFKESRRDIARILTILKKKSLQREIMEIVHQNEESNSTKVKTVKKQLKKEESKK